MDTLGQLDGPKHSDFLSFLNYIKPQSERGGKLLIGKKEINFEKVFK